MHKTYKFRLYPTKAQQTKMVRSLELCRNVYNRTLEEHKRAYKERKETLSKYTLNNMLPVWKEENPELKEVFSQTLQEVQERVDLAFKHFFHRIINQENPGYPRFKGKGWYDSFTYPQMGFKLVGSKLYLSKIGDVYIRLHRKVEGKVKRVTIRKGLCNKWYASLTIESDNTIIHKRKSSCIGIDMGLYSFLTKSDGEKIANPRFFKTEEKELAKVQRRLCEMDKDDARRKKVIKNVQRIHERINNKRYNFIHQISKKLSSEYGFIAFEDLNISGMVQNHYLAKSISDVAWKMLINTTKYKAERAGATVVLVNPLNTSKMCSRCGFLVDKKLEHRVHECPSCGLKLDRDINAAINILRLGLQSAGVITVEARGL